MHVGLLERDKDISLERETWTGNMQKTQAGGDKNRPGRGGGGGLRQ